MKKTAFCLALMAFLLGMPVLAAPPATSPVVDGDATLPAEAWEEMAVELENVVHNDITITPCMAPSPNVFGSPSWDGFVEKAMTMMRSDEKCRDVGDRSTDPTAVHVLYQNVDGEVYYSPGDAMVTSFHSWRGQADPSAPFENEYGNRMNFMFAAESDGTVEFTCADVLGAWVSSDHGFDYSFSFSGAPFGPGSNGGVVPSLVGVNHGPDNLLNTEDDIVYDSGSCNGVALHALYYVRGGTAYWPGYGDPMAGQASINSVREYYLSQDVEIGMLYIIRGNEGSMSAKVDQPFFANGFESGDLSGWTLVGP